MRQHPVFVLLGIIQIIILTLFGLYFYRLTHTTDQDTSSTMTEDGSAVEIR